MIHEELELCPDCGGEIVLYSSSMTAGYNCFARCKKCNKETPMPEAELKTHGATIYPSSIKKQRGSGICEKRWYQMSERMSVAEYKALIQKGSGTKFHNQKTEIDGIMLDSKGEANRYGELKLLERAEKITDLKLQVKYELIPKQPGERAVTYTVDFDYYEGGRHVAEDFKGKTTQQYVIRRKLFKQKYHEIEFREIK